MEQWGDGLVEYWIGEKLQKFSTPSLRYYFFSSVGLFSALADWGKIGENK